MGQRKQVAGQFLDRFLRVVVNEMLQNRLNRVAHAESFPDVGADLVETVINAIVEVQHDEFAVDDLGGKRRVWSKSVTEIYRHWDSFDRCRGR